VNKGAGVRFLIVFLLWFVANSACGGENRLLSCRSVNGAMGYPQIRHPPRRVLLVPLLSKEPYSQISERWAEQPANNIAAFYRNRFDADVSLLRNIKSWEDYYQQIGQLLRQSAPFDRVIFVGHGGFDGPILKAKVFFQDLSITGKNGRLLQFSEAQPGLKNVLSITYDIEKNQVFTNHIASHLQELAELGASEVRYRLKGLEKLLQPLDSACFNRYCSPDKLVTARPGTYQSRIELCELVCREPLFDLKASVEISSERFFLFANTLKSLATPDGLIFFGSCNPGSQAPTQERKRGDVELLINSPLAAGPYESYVHLVGAVSGRLTAGPIGNSSAEDIVDRIIRFETNQTQNYLCVVAPTLH